MARISLIFAPLKHCTNLQGTLSPSLQSLFPQSLFRQFSSLSFTSLSQDDCGKASRIARPNPKTSEGPKTPMGRRRRRRKALIGNESQRKLHRVQNLYFTLESHGEKKEQILFPSCNETKIDVRMEHGKKRKRPLCVSPFLPACQCCVFLRQSLTRNFAYEPQEKHSNRSLWHPSITRATTPARKSNDSCNVVIPP